MGKKSGRARRVEMALRQQLWEEDPHCKECGTVTIHPMQIAAMCGLPSLSDMALAAQVCPKLLRRMATLEHVYSRLNPKRAQGLQKYEILCNSCNSKRARIENDTQEAKERSHRMNKELLALEQQKKKGRNL